MSKTQRHELANSVLACVSEVRGALDAIVSCKDDQHAGELAGSLLPPAAKDARDLYKCCARLPADVTDRAAAFAAADGLRVWFERLTITLAAAECADDDDDDGMHAVLAAVNKDYEANVIRLQAITRVTRCWRQTV